VGYGYSLNKKGYTLIRIRKPPSLRKNDKFTIMYTRCNNFAQVYIYFKDCYYDIMFIMPRLYYNEFDTKRQVGVDVPTAYNKFFSTLKELSYHLKRRFKNGK